MAAFSAGGSEDFDVGYPYTLLLLLLLGAMPEDEEWHGASAGS